MCRHDRQGGESPAPPRKGTGAITELEGSGKLLDYSATKGAIHAITKSLARNLVRRPDQTLVSRSSNSPICSSSSSLATP
jgi:hypothetical protein